MRGVFKQFIRSLKAHGYAPYPLDGIILSPEARRVYLRYDVRPGDLDIGLRLAKLHCRLRVPGTFHLMWDLIEGTGRLETVARRFRAFDPRYVRLGLQCDPLSRWLAQTLFGGDLGELDRFVWSPEFPSYLGEMLQAWRAEREKAPALRAIRDGAWECLVELDRSFRRALGESSSISGRGSSLSNAFSRARQARPELAAIAAWFSPIDLLVLSDLEQLGYRFEATRFAPGGGPGPVVVFGGVDIADLREALEFRIGGGGGVVAIFPVEYWKGDRYADLLPFPRTSAQIKQQMAQAVPAAPDHPMAQPIPAEPFITREKHLVRLGWRCERVDKRGLAAVARSMTGGAIDLSFPRFVEWLRSEGYVFDGFENGPLRFDERRAYLRYDVHIQDLLAAYVLADLHERLGIVGSFQIMWKFSRYEEALEPYFTKLLEFDRRFVRFGLHAAPTASWYSYEKLGGDHSKQVEAVSSEDFAAWLLDLHAAYRLDGDDAPGLREIRQGTDDTLSRIAASFRATFGVWKSISAHGNYLTNGFAEVCARHPEVAELRPYFHPVDYFAKWGVARFGFDYEITALGSDSVPFPRVMLEGNSAMTRRRWYRGRVAHGAGFVALLHPATWTCSHNATFFLPEETESPMPGDTTAGVELRPGPPDALLRQPAGS
jgi:hypothetical protein